MRAIADGNEMTLGSGSFERSSVAWTQDGRVAVAADRGEQPDLWFGEEPVRGSAFAMRVLVNGMEKNPIYANRCFLPRVVVDADGGVLVSFKTGTKELDLKKEPGTTRGVALAAVFAGDEPEVVLALADVGHAQADVVAGKPGCVVLGTLGKWAQFDAGLARVAGGAVPAGKSGEKIQFRIAPKVKNGAVVWHTCHNGYSGESSRYWCTGRPAGITWAAHAKYPSQGSDLNHPGLGVDAKKPRKAVMGAVFADYLHLNVAESGVLEFDPAKLKCVGKATLENRHGPQFIPYPKGGMFCLFNLKGKVMGFDVYGWLADPVKNPVQELASGRFASGAFNKSGRLAMVYARDKKLLKREFRMEVTP